MREIRMLRSTRRGLETRHGRDGVTLADERARQQGTQTSTYTGAPVLDPTMRPPWPHHRRPTSATKPAGQDLWAPLAPGIGDSTAPMAAKSQSFPDNVVAQFGRP